MFKTVKFAMNMNFNERENFFYVYLPVKVLFNVGNYLCCPWRNFESGNWEKYLEIKLIHTYKRN